MIYNKIETQLINDTNSIKIHYNNIIFKLNLTNYLD